MSLLLNTEERVVSPLALAVMLLPETNDTSHTLLQELFAFFGEENAKTFIQFLYCFGGRTLCIPSASKVANTVLAVRVYLRCEELLKKGKPRKEVVSEVSSEFNVSTRKISGIRNAVSQKLSNLERNMRECLEDKKA